MAKATARAGALPQYNDIRSQRRQARGLYRTGTRANRRAYGDLDATLEDIGNDYRSDYGALGTGYRRGISALGGLAGFGGGVEGATAAGGFGGVAASGMRGLAQQRQRGIEYTRSTRTQGAVEEKSNALSLLNAFRQEMEELRQQRSDVAAEEGANTRALVPQYQDMMHGWRMDRRSQELAEDQFALERQMAEQEMERQSSLSDWMQGFFQNMYGRGGGGQGTAQGFMPNARSSPYWGNMDQQARANALLYGLSGYGGQQASAGSFGSKA